MNNDKEECIRIVENLSDKNTYNKIKINIIKKIRELSKNFTEEISNELFNDYMNSMFERLTNFPLKYWKLIKTLDIGKYLTNYSINQIKAFADIEHALIRSIFDYNNKKEKVEKYQKNIERNNKENGAFKSTYNPKIEFYSIYDNEIIEDIAQGVLTISYAKNCKDRSCNITIDVSQATLDSWDRGGTRPHEIGNKANKLKIYFNIS